MKGNENLVMALNQCRVAHPAHYFFGRHADRLQTQSYPNRPDRVRNDRP